MKKEALKAAGLTDKESKLFLACLQLGPSLVQSIANRAGLNRTSAYDLLKSLEAKGFVSYTLTSGKRFYQATHPRNIPRILKEKERLVQKALPELTALCETAGKKPKVEVFVGKAGIKSLFEDILKEAAPFLCLASKIHLSKLFKFYIPHFVKRRIKKKIKVKLISDAVPYDKNAPHKIIKQKFKTATWIYADKLAMISLEEKEPIGILIKEKNFVATHRLMFDMLWKNLK